MCAHDGHADAGGGDLDVLVLPDLVRLLHHLHLLLVVAQLHIHLGVVGEQVEGVLHGEDLGLCGLAVQHVAGLSAQLLHGGSTGTGGSLVGGHHHPLDVCNAVQGGDGHEGNDGGAVGVCDDGSPLAQLDVGHGLGVHLGNHQGDTLGHAEGGAVVNHHRASSCCNGAQGLADRASSAEQSDVNALEAVLSQLLNSVGVSIKLLLLASGPSRGQQLNVTVGKVALLEHRQELLAHGTSHTHNSHSWAIAGLSGLDHRDASTVDPASAGALCLHLLAAESGAAQSLLHCC
mmetsp:Transcript_10224/g.21896  ORF Transcript_10224/g.21896 Transcript_10224/m.21896 type:complete len:289 (-) Transcript_10224:43-909(-)